jgi:hypothetical protein
MQNEKGKMGRGIVAILTNGRGRPAHLICLFPFAFCIAAVAADGSLNPDDPAYLRRQYVWFQAQDPARQQQLRKLDADFRQLPPEDQARLTRVTQVYNAWLAKLPEADRQRVLAAPSAAERLDEVKRIREREWVESLPKPYREEYTALGADARQQKVQEWRNEEAERREEWALAQKHWAENPTGKVPPVFENERPAIEAFAAHLRENLSEPEWRSLDEARAGFDEFRLWFAFGFVLVRLADQHPIFPWKEIGSREWKELPDDVRRQFPRPGELPLDIRRAQGRWPKFAAEVAAYAKTKNLSVPPLGDCRKDQMPSEVVQVIDRLEKELKKTDAGRADLKALDEAQGKWPDYPRMVVDLARKYKQPLVGWALPTPPGQPQFWDRLRTAKGRGK